MDDELTTQEKLAKISIVLVMFELQRMVDKTPSIFSAEEGGRSIQQNVDELLRVISSTQDDEFGNKARLKAAKIVAASAMRFMMEVCLEKVNHGNGNESNNGPEPGATGANSA